LQLLWPLRGARRLFVGTIGPNLKELLKALSHLGAVQHTLIVYEAGPGGYVWVRPEAAPRWNVVMRYPIRGYQTDQSSLQAPRVAFHLRLCTAPKLPSALRTVLVKNSLAPVDTRGSYQNL
jgi:hypothetical protein